MTGAWAEANPDVIRRIGDEGHQFINHTWDHPSFTGALSVRRRSGRPSGAESARTTDDLIRELSGRTEQAVLPAAVRRPERGCSEGRGRCRLRLHDHVDGRFIRLEQAAGRWDRGSLFSCAEPGAIYIMHVGSDSEDALALGPILEGLRARGLGFATISGELLGV